MDIVVASNNKHKIVEIETFLHKYVPDAKVLSLSDIGYTREIAENGKTFEENALIKAKTIAKLGYIAVADDSGLEVDALGGKPGVYSARYAGEPCDDRKNNKKLLAAMDGLYGNERSARFVSVIAGVFPDGRQVTARGECPGEMLTEYRGTGGFGYDPLFYYAPLGKTFAEMTADEKNAVSHRSRAMAAFAEKFYKELK